MGATALGWSRLRPCTAALLTVPLLLTLASCGVLGAGPAPGASTTASSPPASGSPPFVPTPSRGTSPSAGPSSASPTPSTPGTPSPSGSGAGDDCADLVRRLSLEQRVGQLLMVAVPSSGASTAEIDVLQRTHAGSVILLGNSTAG